MSDKNGLPTGKHTLVEEGTEFKGTMSSKCPIVVMGKVEGEVAGPIIHVTATGVVAGSVKVKEFHSHGEVAGEVEADSVRISGKVRDRTIIKARTLEVSLTADKGGMQVQFGECELAIGDEPNKEAAITAATTAPAPAPVVSEPVAPAAVEVTQLGVTAAEPSRTVTKSERRKGQPEVWDEANKAAAEGEPQDPKRKRGTLPPPATH